MKPPRFFLFSLICFFIICTNKADGQFYHPTLSNNIWEIRDTFYLNMDPLADTLEGGIIRQFKRWENIWLPRLAPTGDMGIISEAMQEYSIYLDGLTESYYDNDQSLWTELGPSQNGLFGIGRIDAIAFDPVDEDIMYVGAPCGGVWKTGDGGLNWTSLKTDKQLLRLGVSTISQIR